MKFKPGDPKPPGSGRKPGQVGKQTLLAREGLKSAIQICREGGDDPISIMVNASRFLNTVAAAFAPRAPLNATPAEVAAAVRAVKPQDLEFMRRFLVDAATIAHKAAEFGYAKLQRIDYAGDVPAAPTVENKMVFVLNIDGGQAPGRPVVNGQGEDDGRGEDGYDDERPAIEHHDRD